MRVSMAGGRVLVDADDRCVRWIVLMNDRWHLHRCGSVPVGRRLASGSQPELVVGRRRRSGGGLHGRPARNDCSAASFDEGAPAHGQGEHHHGAGEGRALISILVLTAGTGTVARRGNDWPAICRDVTRVPSARIRSSRRSRTARSLGAIA